MNAIGKAVHALRVSAALALAMHVSVPAVAQSPAADPPRSRFDLALLHLERCQWPQAFSQLSALADEGHAEAARIALLMRAHGPRLFGHTFVADVARRERWLDAAAPMRTASSE